MASILFESLYKIVTSTQILIVTAVVCFKTLQVPSLLPEVSLKVEIILESLSERNVTFLKPNKNESTSESSDN